MSWTWTTIYYIIIITIITATIFYVQYLYVFISHVIEEHIILHLTGWRGSPLLSFSRVFFRERHYIMCIYFIGVPHTHNMYIYTCMIHTHDNRSLRCTRSNNTIRADAVVGYPTSFEFPIHITCV